MSKSHGHSHGGSCCSSKQHVSEQTTKHIHSKDCPHLVIPHKTGGPEGNEHIGFLVDGNLECFTPNFERAGKDCRLSMKTKRQCCEPGPCSVHVIQCDGNNHNVSLLIKHGDHFDHLVKDKSGSFVMHHRTSDTCVDHGVLQPLLAEKNSNLQNAFSFSENLDWFETIYESEPTSIKLHVAGLCCSSEISLIEQILYPIPGVVQGSVSFNLISRDVTVKCDERVCRPDILVDALNQAHLDASAYDKVDEQSTTTTTRKKIKKISFPPWNVILGFILWLLSFLSFVEEPAYMYEFRWLSVIACALCLPRIALKGFSALRRRRLDVNCLMSIAVIGALALQDFEEAGGVVVIFSLSHWLEDLATSKARSSLEKIMELKPENARILPNGETDQTVQTVIDVEKVKIGNICLVRPGDKVPVDGIVVLGTGSLDESSLTGESVPVHKALGDSLQAGTIHVGNTVFILKATALSKDSAIARLVKLVEESAIHRSPTEQMVDKVAAIYTPIVVLVALLLGTIPFAWGKEVGLQYVYIALTLLVVACPCAFVISTPITYVCGIAKAAQNGVIIKGGKYLETLAAIQILAVDKTGTITTGSFSIIDFETNTDEKNLDTPKKVQLHIPKMCCKKEASIVSDVVNHLLGLNQVTVTFDIPKRLVTIIPVTMDISNSIEEVQSLLVNKNAKLVSTQIRHYNLNILNSPDLTAITEILKQIPGLVNIEATKENCSFCLPITSSIDQIIEKLANYGFTATVSDAKNLVNLNRKDIVHLIAAMELSSVHPLALAFQRFAQIEGVSIQEDLVQNLEIVPGEGVRGTLKDGGVISIGNKRMLTSNDSKVKHWASKHENQGATTSFVMLNGKLIAYFAASDTIRPEAQEALQCVNKLGLRVVMLTGDNEGSATTVSRVLSPSISEIHAGLRPEDKVEWIKKLRGEKKKSRVVAMIGDGVNDAPSLAIANVSLAMGVAGSPVAIESADIALMDSDLRKISWIISLGRSVRFKVFTNLSFSIFIKLIMIGLSIAGYVSLGVAIGVDVGAMLIVTLNGVHLLRKPKQIHEIPEISIP